MKPGSRFIEKKEIVPDHRIIITNIRGKLTISCFDADGQLLDFRPADQKNSILGNIYVGRVEKVIKSLSACFVDIGICHCFLPFDEYRGVGDLPKQGDKLVVQIKRDAVKTKEPSCSCFITLTGRSVVISEKKKGATSIGVSKKLNDKSLRDSLKKEFSVYMDELHSGESEYSYEVMIRTNGIHDTGKTRSELKSLYHKLQNIRENACHRTDFSLMYEETKQYIRFVRDFSLFEKKDDKSSVVEVITDEKNIYRELSEYIPNWSDLFTLRLYEDPSLSLNSLYRIEHFADELLTEKVWLKSGGYLVIEQTEALNVIDVNSGKIQPKKGSKDNVYKLNEEAAVEAARQIRLRNLSGIILIDFINDEKDGEEKLISFVSSLMKEDRIRCRFVDVTKLGLFEFTRHRIDPSLKELYSVKS